MGGANASVDGNARKEARGENRGGCVAGKVCGARGAGVAGEAMAAVSVGLVGAGWVRTNCRAAGAGDGTFDDSNDVVKGCVSNPGARGWSTARGNETGV